MEGKLSFKTGKPKFKSCTVYKLCDLSKLTWPSPPHQNQMCPVGLIRPCSAGF